MLSTTLLEVMDAHVRTSSNSTLECWDPSQKQYVAVSYSELCQRAFAFGASLLESSQQDIKGRVVMIACHAPYATLVAFYGAISVGAIPMIFPMPLSLGSHEALTKRINHWGLSFETPAMLVLEADLEEKFHEFIPDEITTVHLRDNPGGEWPIMATSANQHQPNSNDPAFYQTTSSSTGDHKAVAISHSNILANVNGIREAVDMQSDESMASWLPLFHDMGLVGAVLFSFCNNYTLYIMTPTQFIKRPAMWLKTMDEHKCTIATAPNFGFDYCSRLVSVKDRDALKLDHVKHLFIGAEPIRVSTIRSFLDKFKPCGITPQVIRPAYGLAESTIITSISSPVKLSEFICIEADTISIGEKIKVLDTLDFNDESLARYDLKTSTAVCTAGKAIDEMQISLVDEEHQPITEEGIVGEIHIKGSSVAMGYVWGGEQARLDPFENQAVLTGDIGVIHEGELYILERIKNIIIRNGENYMVSALEEQLAELLGISHEHVAVFESDIHDPSSDIVVLVERHSTIDNTQIDALLASMPKEAFPINKILLSKAREIPRTTSGKKRHFYCRQEYQKGSIQFQQEIEVSPQRIAQAINAQQN